MSSGSDYAFSMPQTASEVAARIAACGTPDRRIAPVARIAFVLNALPVLVFGAILAVAGEWPSEI
jgi:hypothetical protein